VALRTASFSSVHFVLPAKSYNKVIRHSYCRLFDQVLLIRSSVDEQRMASRLACRVDILIKVIRAAVFGFARTNGTYTYHSWNGGYGTLLDTTIEHRVSSQLNCRLRLGLGRVLISF
jgi:hypothetical protein